MAEGDDAGLHAAAHQKLELIDDQLEGMRDEMTRVYERLEDVEAMAHASVMMHLEDDVDDKPGDESKPEERTEVEERTETPAGEKKDDAPAEPPAERHAGLFL